MFQKHSLQYCSQDNVKSCHIQCKKKKKEKKSKMLIIYGEIMLCEFM